MRSLYNIYLKKNKPAEQDLLKRPFGKISATDLYAMSLYKVSIRDVLAKTSVQDLYKRSHGKTLEEISIEEISIQDLCEGSQSKICVQAL